MVVLHRGLRRCLTLLAHTTMGKIRSWKPATGIRASGSTNVPQLRSSWDKRLQQRAERAALQAAQREVDEKIRSVKQEERKRREEKEKKKEENKQKGMQYQVISNTSKIKKMSKRQLKNIKKMDTTKK
uniref:Coiled-coil domain-containing protein 86 n=1 Tax=Chrysotila carterae TaxID=13221 RepID=A0A7S4C5K7_CHRCT|mmetsp:Transcript_19535/g.41268  ORF Transcript_19535/g.41268 Transcript_19535/m.41268 type:complete len:128 (+) Transcript_19535:1-384(+)